MPTGIAKRGIGSRAGIGRRQIGARYAVATAQEPFTFTPGSYTFTPPKAGYWKFVLWGGGGAANGATNGGPSGAYVEKTAFLTPANSVAITIGAAGADSTAALSGGTITAGAGNGSGNVAGVASGGDVNLNGSIGATTPGASGAVGGGTGGGAGGSPAGSGLCGAGAPANLPYRGGAGGDSNNALPPLASNAGRSPGGGGSYDSAVPQSIFGGHGLGIVVFIKD